MASFRHIILAAALCAVLGAVHGRRPGRLVEGKKTSIEKAPWLVQLVGVNFLGGVGDMATCAGSIIDSERVLTSAHCFGDDPNPSASNKILVGATGVVDTEKGVLLAIESVAKHPKYNGGNQKYDLAVVKLAEPIEFTDKIQPIAIANKPVPANTKVYGGGWGTTRTDPTAPPKVAPYLKTAEMTKMSRESCDQWLQGVAMAEENAAAMLCMQPKTGVPCAGDSGSAAWVPAKGDKPAQLFGVLQGGVTCELDDAVPLYVDILHKDVKDFLVENGVLKKKNKAHALNF